ncbi:hypothetical protein ACA910_005207 [Epithemia clementina (nom. ined.)]
MALQEQAPEAVDDNKRQKEQPEQPQQYSTKKSSLMGTSTHTATSSTKEETEAAADFKTRRPPNHGSRSGRSTKLVMDELSDDDDGYDDMDLQEKLGDDEPSNAGAPLGGPSDWKKYSHYELEVDPNQDDRAVEIELYSLARPHMRSFHASWWCFFTAFFIWFSIAPLLSEIRDDLGLTKSEVWTSSIAGVGGTIFMRFLLGPLCDKYGARVLFTGTLCAAAIPTACTGFVQTATGLTILRLFIGVAGGTFVMCQYWISMTFTKEVVGTANALGAGWGNLGGGVTQLVVGSILFPMFKWIYGGDSEKSWRTVCVIPAFVAFCSGITVYMVADDSPKGQYWERKKHGTMPEVSARDSFRDAAYNWNTWILFVQYACCFGVELTMNSAMALYFKDEFGQTTESAAAIASVFGWMNLFARGCGGILSDYANSHGGGMGGRILTQTYFLAFEGVLILIFASSQTLAGAISIMIVFSLFVQAAEGSSFGIVPYVDPRLTGAISGIVGAGGNTGAVLFGLGFLNFSYRSAFFIMGFAILLSSLLSAFIKIEGQTTLLSHGEENGANATDDKKKQKGAAHFLHWRLPKRKEEKAAKAAAAEAAAKAAAEAANVASEEHS